MTQRLDSIAHHLISRSAVPAEGGVSQGRPLPSISAQLGLGRKNFPAQEAPFMSLAIAAVEPSTCKRAGPPLPR